MNSDMSALAKSEMRLLPVTKFGAAESGELINEYRAGRPWFYLSAPENGEVEILHLGRRASTLRGQDALEFLSEVESSSTSEMQQLMARITGNYKHGNERQASQHPRNRR